MPELPEVETVKKSLLNKLKNQTIRYVNVLYPNVISNISVDEFQKKIKEQTILDIQRRGKWLMFELNDYYLLSHLRMEGKYFFRNKQDDLAKHEHVVFSFDSFELRYHDTRKFGKMHLVKKEDVYLVEPLLSLGKEPFDESLTVEYLKEKYKNKKLPIKTVILDQSIIVGIGNIYADEILFLSNINPFKKTNELNDYELNNIIINTKKVLIKAIEEGGTTIRSYTSSEGVHGKFQHSLLVHNKEGFNCPLCNETIVKTKINGRGTYYCPKCQK